MWEWDTGNQSIMGSQPAGPLSSGVATVPSTGKANPRPDGTLGTLLLWNPPTRLSTGHMNTLNIPQTQVCITCTMSPDTWKIVNFTKQVSTGRRNHGVAVYSMSHWNTSPQTMNCVSQLSSGQANFPEIWPTWIPHTINPQTQHDKQKFSPPKRAPTRTLRVGPF